MKVESIVRKLIQLPVDDIDGDVRFTRLVVEPGALFLQVSGPRPCGGGGAHCGWRGELDLSIWLRDGYGSPLLLENLLTLTCTSY